MAHGRREEDAIQRAVFQHIKARRGIGVFAFHVPNGGKRSRVEASILKGLGVVAGIPDVIMFKTMAGTGRCEAYALEIKTGTGRVSPTQIETMRALQRAGVIVRVTYGLDHALATLEEWGILEGRAQ